MEAGAWAAAASRQGREGRPRGPLDVASRGTRWAGPALGAGWGGVR